jgi:hypothetical protein
MRRTQSEQTSTHMTRDLERAVEGRSKLPTIARLLQVARKDRLLLRPAPGVPEPVKGHVVSVVYKRRVASFRVRLVLGCNRSEVVVVINVCGEDLGEVYQGRYTGRHERYLYTRTCAPVR